MKKTITISFLLLAIIYGTALQAQQVPYFSQYMFNHYLINPAAAGSKSQMPVMLGYRSQWSGLTNAPTTLNLSAHTPFRENMGLGAMVYNDKTGPTSWSSMQLSYAYHMRVGFYDLKLSFGLSGMLNQNTVNQALLTTDLPGDIAISGNIQKSLKPNAAFGTYLHNDKFFFGYSLPQLFEVKISNTSNSLYENKTLRHNFLTAGYRFSIAGNYKLEPSFLLKSAKETPMQIDLNTKLIYKDAMWVGVSYRSSQSIIAMVGVTKNKISFGYSYDMTLTSINSYSSGSHELFIGINLNKLSKKQEVPPTLEPAPAAPEPEKEKKPEKPEEEEIQEDKGE